MYLNNPEYIKVGDKKYKINTDFRIALKCNEVATDENIKDIEKIYAIIYMLFGEEALEDSENYDEFLRLAYKYLLCGQKKKKETEEPDMDYIQDMPYIKASFRSDYNINLDEEKMHWWDFFHLMEGLSNSEFGNCCVLNKIRNLRTYDTSKITDLKELEKIKKAQENVSLKKKKKQNLSEKQIKNHDNFMVLAGLNKKEE